MNSLKEKQYDRTRKAAKRASGRNVELHAPKDLPRRRACLENPEEFMVRYFGWIFSEPFTPARTEMVQSILHASRYSGDFAVADKRGGGKSSIAMFTTFWLDLRGELLLPLVIGKNQCGAEQELRNLKQALVESPDFADDFPEICLPIIALQDWASAARKQTVNGFQTKIGWEKDCLFLPTVPQEALPANWPHDERSTAIGQGIAVVGISGRIRGFKRRNVRPGLAVIDDVDDRESARSEVQTADYRKAIDTDAIGLAGSGKRTSRVMLCTTINDHCIAAIYTALPSWRGQRFKAITKWPERRDLQDEYMAMRATRPKDDPDARVAHKFYLAHREDIERGGEVGNPYDYVSKPAADGEPLEVSPLQHYFNYIADTDMTSFLCEYQNDPPEDTGIVESDINPQMIQRQVSGLARGVVPEGCTALVQGIDIGKWELYWVVRAFKPDGTGYTIDYGISKTFGAKHGSDEGLDRVIRREILRRIADFQDMPYAEDIRDTLTLVDSGYRTDAVYAACREAGMGVMPIKGIGQSAGVAQKGVFHDVMKRTIDKRKICTGVYFSRQRDPKQDAFDLVCASADQWKAWEHDRWMTAADKPGCMFLFGFASDTPDRMSPDQREHGAYATMICNEKEVEEEVKGVLKRYWKPYGANHWLDASYYADVAAAIKGIRVLSGGKVQPVTPPSARPTMEQLAKARKR